MVVELTANLDPDLPIVDAILEGDQAAFEEFVQRNHRWVKGVIYGVLGDSDRSDDVLQVVWTTAWQQLHTLTDPNRWRTWLYRLARNAAVDSGRELTRRRKLSKSFKEHLSSTGQSPGRRGGRSEEHQRVLRAIKALPALYREPFVLRHLEGWSYKEIAELFGMPVDTVETRLVRARRQLRELLGGG